MLTRDTTIVELIKRVKNIDKLIDSWRREKNWRGYGDGAFSKTEFQVV
jgi:hypothetical protein